MNAMFFKTAFLNYVLRYNEGVSSKKIRILNLELT